MLEEIYREGGSRDLAEAIQPHGMHRKPKDVRDDAPDLQEGQRRCWLVGIEFTAPHHVSSTPQPCRRYPFAGTRRWRPA